MLRGPVVAEMVPVFVMLLAEIDPCPEIRLSVDRTAVLAPAISAEGPSIWISPPRRWSHWSEKTALPRSQGQLCQSFATSDGQGSAFDQQATRECPRPKARGCPPLGWYPPAPSPASPDRSSRQKSAWSSYPERCPPTSSLDLTKAPDLARCNSPAYRRAPAAIAPQPQPQEPAASPIPPCEQCQGCRPVPAVRFPASAPVKHRSLAYSRRFSSSDLRKIHPQHISQKAPGRGFFLGNHHLKVIFPFSRCSCIVPFPPSRAGAAARYRFSRRWSRRVLGQTVPDSFGTGGKIRLAVWPILFLQFPATDRRRKNSPLSRNQYHGRHAESRRNSNGKSGIRPR